jgi:hypothetical protein
MGEPGISVTELLDSTRSALCPCWPPPLPPATALPPPLPPPHDHELEGESRADKAKATIKRSGEKIKDMFTG